VIEHLSHSAVDGLLTCGEKWRLTRIERVPEVPTWAVVGGDAVHIATAAADAADFGMDVEDPQDFPGAFELAIARREERSGIPSTEWVATGRPSKEWPDKQNRAWWEANGPSHVAAWASFLRNSPWQVAILPDGQPAIEVKLEAEIGGVPVVGYIDRVLEEGRSEVYAVTDLKSGAREPKSARQLGVYAVLMDRVMGFGVTWGMYYMTRKGTTSEPVDLTRYRDGSLDHDYAKAWAMVEAEIFVPNPGDLCSVCGVRPYCREMGGDAERASSVRQYPAPSPGVSVGAEAPPVSEEN